VGAQLAQIELEVVFADLFPAIPGLRLAVPADEIFLGECGTGAGQGGGATLG
jgi:hypothetical protein